MQRTTSTLEKSLRDILDDTNACDHFVAYLNADDGDVRRKVGAAMVLFWLEERELRYGPVERLLEKGDHMITALSAATSADAVADDDELRLPDSLVERSREQLECGERYALSLLADWCFERLEVVFVDPFRRSPHFLSHQLDLLTSGRLGIADLALHALTVLAFTEFCEQAGHATTLQFWLAATMFQNQVLQEQDEEMDGSTENDNLANEKAIDDQHAMHLKEAMSLYDRYLSLQARQPLRAMTPAVRHAVESNVCTDGDGDDGGTRVRHDCFAPALALVERQLSVCCDAFLSSQLFFGVVARCMTQLRRAGITKRISRTAPPGASSTMPQQPSAAASSVVFAVSKTASDVDGSFGSRRRSEETTSLTGTSGTERHRQRLGMASVSALGQYQSSFEPAPPDKPVVSNGGASSAAMALDNGSVPTAERRKSTGVGSRLKSMFGVGRRQPTLEERRRAEEEAQRIIAGVTALTRPELFDDDMT